VVCIVIPVLCFKLSPITNHHPISVSFKAVGFLFQVPTKEQVDTLSKELLARSSVPGTLITLLATCVIVFPLGSLAN
jgi:hypothetical protein